MTIAISGTNGITLDGQFDSASSMGFKNRIINGGMVIDQRNAGASVTPTNGSFGLDRWCFNATAASKFTAQQNAGAVTPPAGFANYLGVTSSSAYSVTSGDIFSIFQGIEGFNIADLAWGTASAATVTLSFRVYSSLTGTFGGALRNSTAARAYPFTYSIPTANTWTTISVTIAGDTSGTWLTTNGVGINLSFGLGGGSTYSGTAGAWSGAGNFITATGAVSVVGTNGATFFITGVQLEKGSTATSFDYRPIETEFALCQRYYYKISGNTQYARFGHGFCGAGSSTNFYATVIFPVSMRAAPTSVDTAGSLGVWNGGAITAASAITLDTSANTAQVSVAFVTSSGMTAQSPYQLIGNNSGTASLAFSSEL